MSSRYEFIKILEYISGISRITDDILVYHDLNITGDDADELMQEIEKKFGTRFDGFIFQDYFPDEFGSWPLWILRLFGRQPKQKKLSVGHLVAVIDRGHWFPPDRE